jgi:hypothetical protein
VRTAADALQDHGLTGEQLLGLSRKAASDALRRKGAFLDPGRFEDLADYMLEVGVKHAASYEPGHGLSLVTFLYRRMRIRYVDWCRSTLGDSRVAIHAYVPPGGFCFCGSRRRWRSGGRTSTSAPGCSTCRARRRRGAPSPYR